MGYFTEKSPVLGEMSPVFSDIKPHNEKGPAANAFDEACGHESAWDLAGY